MDDHYAEIYNIKIRSRLQKVHLTPKGDCNRDGEKLELIIDNLSIDTFTKVNIKIYNSGETQEDLRRLIFIALQIK